MNDVVTDTRDSGTLTGTLTGTLGPGDLIAFSGQHWDSFLINVFSYGIPFLSCSHVGILGHYCGELLLFESTTLSDIPCEIQGKPVKGVQAVRLEDRLETYEGKAYHYPLAVPLSNAQSAKLSKFLLDKIGTDYDYLGAMRSAGAALSWVESKLNKESLRELFCSELCAAAHKTVDILPTDNASKWNPNKLLRFERKKGILLKPKRLK